MDSPRPGVSTTLAYHENFESGRAVSSRNHLTVVGEGVTTITLRYPYLKEGAAGALLLVLLLWRKRGDDAWKTEEKTEPEQTDRPGSAS